MNDEWMKESMDEEVSLVGMNPEELQCQYHKEHVTNW